jgi:hypothetical protein
MVLGIEGYLDPEVRTQVLLQALPIEDRKYASLVAAIIENTTLESEFSMSSDEKFGILKKIIVKIFFKVKNKKVILIFFKKVKESKTNVLFIIEDTHWMCSCGWLLLNEVISHLPKAMFLITMRHIEEAEILSKIRSYPNTKFVHLSSLAINSTKTMICQLFSVQNAPDELVKLVHNKAEGNPLFIEELALWLVQNGRLKFVEVTSLDGSVNKQIVFDSIMENSEIPETLEGNWDYNDD